MSERQMLERARGLAGRSGVELADVYRRRDAVRRRQRLQAGAVAGVVVAIAALVMARLVGVGTSEPEGRLETPTPTVRPSPLEQAQDWAFGQRENVTPPLHHVQLSAVAGSERGFVVVGVTEVSERGPIGGGTDPVWFSSDGRSWTRAPTGPDAMGLWDVAAGGPGWIAVGQDQDSKPAAWYSSDGLTWARAMVALPPGVRWGRVSGIFPTTGGSLMWGEVRAGGWHGCMWISPDGMTWSLLPDESMFDPGVDVMGVRDGEFVAIGGIWAPSAPGDARAWTSGDGVTWTRIPYDDTVLASTAVRQNSSAVGPTGAVAIDSIPNYIGFRPSENG